MLAAAHGAEHKIEIFGRQTHHSQLGARAVPQRQGQFGKGQSVLLRPGDDRRFAGFRRMVRRGIGRTDPVRNVRCLCGRGNARCGVGPDCGRTADAKTEKTDEQKNSSGSRPPKKMTASCGTACAAVRPAGCPTGRKGGVAALHGFSLRPGSGESKPLLSAGEADGRGLGQRLESDGRGSYSIPLIFPKVPRKTKRGVRCC